MTDEKMIEFIRNIPKAENHIHICGSIFPEVLLKLAKKNNVELPFRTVEESDSFYNFKNLDDFIDSYRILVTALMDEQDFRDVTVSIGEMLAKANVKYCELMIGFSCHEPRGVSFETVAKGIMEGRKIVYEKYGVTLAYMADVDRTFSPEYNENYVSEIVKMKDELGLVAIDLASSENGYPARLHKEAYRIAKENGLKVCMHAGEDCGPVSIWEALSYGADRIEHGVRSIDDPELMKVLKDKNMGLTVCPISNECLKVYDVVDSPVAKLLRYGLQVSINSDDPAFFGKTDVADNYIAVWKAHGLTKEEIVQLAKNSFRNTSLCAAMKMQYEEMIDSYVENFQE